MTFKNIDDITRDNEAKEREEFKSKLADDVSDLFGKFRNENSKRKTEKKKNESILIKLLKILGIIGLGLLVINLIIGNLWLLKFFIKSLIGLE